MTAALVLTSLAAGFLGVFWLSPHGVLALRKRAGGALQVDVRVGYSPDTLFQLLDAYGEMGRADFRWMLRLDMVFPVVYASAIWALASAAGSRVAAPLGAAAALMDYAENVCLLHVLRTHPRRPRPVAIAAGVATSSKFALIVASMTALMAAALS
jgi:hypothetical protein